MAASERLHLVNIQNKVLTQDPVSGDMVESWGNQYTNIYAAIKPVSGRTFIQSQADQTSVTVRIETDWLPSVDSTMRIVGICSCHSGKIYNPEAVLEDDMEGVNHLTWPCVQGVNEG